MYVRKLLFEFILRLRNGQRLKTITQYDAVGNFRTPVTPQQIVDQRCWTVWHVNQRNRVNFSGAFFIAIDQRKLQILQELDFDGREYRVVNIYLGSEVRLK